MDNNLTKARAYFYEFLAYPLFFHVRDTKFNRWREQLAYLATSPVTPQSEAAFANLAKFDFEKFAREQNDVLFDFSYSNIPLNASFYEDGRDDSAARLRVSEAKPVPQRQRGLQGQRGLRRIYIFGHGDLFARRSSGRGKYQQQAIYGRYE